MTGRRWSLGLVGIGVVYLLFYLAPVAAFLSVSLFESAGPARVGDEVTLSNYAALLDDPYYGELLARTLWISAQTAVWAVALAFAMAWIIARTRSAASSGLFLLVVASMFTSFIVGALGLRLLLSPAGPISAFLTEIGLPPVALAGTEAGVVIGMVHAVLPLAVIALMPACDSVGDDEIKAAYGLGANRLRTFVAIVLPRMMYALVGVALLLFSIATGLFVTPLLLGGGRTGMLAIEIRQQILGLLNYPLGAALAAVLVAIVVIVVASALVVARRTGPVGP